MGYIDPGAFGLIAQIGYVLLFAVVSGFMFFFKPIKNLLKKRFKRQSSEAEHSEMDEFKSTKA